MLVQHTGASIPKINGKRGGPRKEQITVFYKVSRIDRAVI